MMIYVLSRLIQYYSVADRQTDIHTDEPNCYIDIAHCYADAR